jgi:hypothetical protein
MHHARNLFQQTASFLGLAPQSVNASATANGPVISRIDYLSAVVNGLNGAYVSTVSNVAYQLQHGNNANGSDMANLSIPDPITSALGPVIANVTTANTSGSVGCNLESLNPYIRVTATVTGGTSATVAASVTLGGSNVEAPTGAGLSPSPYGVAPAGGF